MKGMSKATLPLLLLRSDFFFLAPVARVVFISRQFDLPGEDRFRRAVAANMAAPRAVVRRGPDRRSGAFDPLPPARPVGCGNSSEIKTLSRVPSVADQASR
jgi:hypothetical protein